MLLVNYIIYLKLYQIVAYHTASTWTILLTLTRRFIKSIALILTSIHKHIHANIGAALHLHRSYVYRHPPLTNISSHFYFYFCKRMMFRVTLAKLLTFDFRLNCVGKVDFSPLLASFLLAIRNMVRTIQIFLGPQPQITHHFKFWWLPKLQKDMA